MHSTILLGLLALTGGTVAQGYDFATRRGLGGQGAKHSGHRVKRADVNLQALYPEHTISVPVDFFPKKDRYKPHSSDTFKLRYWFDASHYEPDGPVFVLLAGEDDGSNKLPYLQKGIVAQVAEATHGIGVVLEHRYYGKSLPTADYSTENLRFLSTEQALAEVNYFARNVKFEGISANLTAPNAPWIVYGGSYPGALAAFLRTQYPETFWGAISSSGTTKAIYDFWQYFEPVRQFADSEVVQNTQFLVDVVDKILLPAKNIRTPNVQKLLNVFGMGDITDVRSLPSALSDGPYYWQYLDWSPDALSAEFGYYQDNLTTTLLEDTDQSQRKTVRELVTAAGYKSTAERENIILNAINWITKRTRSLCPGQTSDECWGIWTDDTFWQIDDWSIRSWYWQACTEYGFWQTGNTPRGQKPIVSRTLDLDFHTRKCKTGFNYTNPPKLQEVNKYGGIDIEYDRLAIIGGNADPWKYATPLADKRRKQRSTPSKPVLEIEPAVHYWEVKGLFPNETTTSLPPPQIVHAQNFIKDFVKGWMKEWRATRGK